MTWLRRNLLLLVALAVLGYMLIPNLVVALFSFNNPVGPLQLHVAASSRPRRGSNPCGAQGICESLGLSLQIGLIASVVGDHPRHGHRLRPRPLPVPGALGDQPAHLHADGDPRGRHGLEPADPVPHDGRAGRPHRGHHRAHHVLHLVRRRRRQGPGGDARPAPRGGGRRPRGQRRPRPSCGSPSRWPLPASSPVRCWRSRSASTTTSSPTSTRARARSRSPCTSGAPPSAVLRCRST